MLLPSSMLCMQNLHPSDSPFACTGQMMSKAQDVSNGNYCSSVTPDNSRVLMVKLRRKTSLVAYSTDKRNKLTHVHVVPHSKQNTFSFYSILIQVLI